MINSKTAKALRLTIPPSVLARAAAPDPELDDDQDEIEDGREDAPSQTGRGDGAAVQPTNARPPAILDPREAPG